MWKLQTMVLIKIEPVRYAKCFIQFFQMLGSCSYIIYNLCNQWLIKNNIVWSWDKAEILRQFWLLNLIPFRKKQRYFTYACASTPYRLIIFNIFILWIGTNAIWEWVETVVSCLCGGAGVTSRCGVFKIQTKDGASPAGANIQWLSVETVWKQH